MLIVLLTIFTIPLVGQSQWILQNSNAVDNLTDIVMLDSVTAIAIGDRNAILRTTDAGTTWMNQTIMLSATFHWNAISLENKNYGTIAGDHTVWNTSDGGITWKFRTAPTQSRKIVSVLQISPSTIYAGDESGYVHRSLDSGNTWVEEKISGWEIRSMFAWPGTYIWGPPIYALTPYSLYCNIGFPQPQWFEDTLEFFKGLGSEAFDGEFSREGGPGFIVGVQGDLRADPTILRKRMLDTMWTKVPTGIMRDGVLMGVSAPSENVVYVCGTSGMLFKSTDGGDTWIDIVVPTTRTLRAIYFFDEKRGFAVGDSGTILYTSNGGVMNAREQQEKIPDLFTLYQNYPNPFNPTTTISYRLPMTDYVTLKVYDFLGREIATLFEGMKQAGGYEVKFNGSGLAGGVYVYQLKAGKYVKTKKCVLIK